MSEYTSDQVLAGVNLLSLLVGKFGDGSALKQVQDLLTELRAEHLAVQEARSAATAAGEAADAKVAGLNRVQLGFGHADADLKQRDADLRRGEAAVAARAAALDVREAAISRREAEHERAISALKANLDAAA
jgi:uncharacterized protein (DUF3084 family)